MSAFILPGKKLKLDTPTLRKHMGEKVIYILKNRYWEASNGIIGEVIRRQVNLGDMDFIPFDRIKEIHLL